LADLFLDTTPYNAGATASAALWAGVPVLTCLGTSLSGRMAASMLHAVGLPELATDSLAAYEALALALARDPARLQSLQLTLEQNKLKHPLFDTARSTRHIEAAYLAMWNTFLCGEPRRPFAVAAEPIQE
jgi:predicted O-linked N-acetylglucosamine transferase (SPINDLY family)